MKKIRTTKRFKRDTKLLQTKCVSATASVRARASYCCWFWFWKSCIRDKWMRDSLYLSMRDRTCERTNEQAGSPASSLIHAKQAKISHTWNCVLCVSLVHFRYGIMKHALCRCSSNLSYNKCQSSLYFKQNHNGTRFWYCCDIAIAAAVRSERWFLCRQVKSFQSNDVIPYFSPHEHSALHTMLAYCCCWTLPFSRLLYSVRLFLHLFIVKLFLFSNLI